MWFNPTTARWQEGTAPISQETHPIYGEEGLKGSKTIEKYPGGETHIITQPKEVTTKETHPVYGEEGLKGTVTYTKTEYYPTNIITTKIFTPTEQSKPIIIQPAATPTGLTHQQAIVQDVQHGIMQTESMVNPVTTQTQQNVANVWNTASVAEQQASLAALGAIKYNPFISLPFTIIAAPAIGREIIASAKEGYAFAQTVGKMGAEKGLLPEKVGTALETPFGVIGAIGANFLVKPLVQEATFIKENPAYGIGAAASIIVYSGLAQKGYSYVTENYEYLKTGERAALISGLDPGDFSLKEKITMGKTLETNMQTFLMEREQLYKVGSGFIAAHPEFTTTFETRSLQSDVLMVDKNTAYGTAENIVAVRGSTIQTFEYSPTLFEGGTVEFRITPNYIKDIYYSKEEFVAQKLATTQKMVDVFGVGKISGASDWLQSKRFDAGFYGVSEELFKNKATGTATGVYTGKTFIKAEGSELVDISKQKGFYTSDVFGTQETGQIHLGLDRNILVDVSGGKSFIIKQVGSTDNVPTFYQGLETVWQEKSKGEGYTYIPASGTGKPMQSFMFMEQSTENTIAAGIAKQTAKESASGINIPSSAAVAEFITTKQQSFVILSPPILGAKTNQLSNLEQGSSSDAVIRSTTAQIMEQKSVVITQLFLGTKMVSEIKQEQLVYQHQGVSQQQSQQTQQLTEEIITPVTTTKIITTPITGTSGQSFDFTPKFKYDQRFPIEGNKKLSFDFDEKPLLKKRSFKTKSRILPTSDLFNIAESESKYGSVHFASGKKAEAEFGRITGSFGVFARFPTFEQIKGKFKL